MVRSNTQPQAIQAVKNLIYMRNNIQQVTETDEMTGQEMTFYEYDEILVQGYSTEFVTAKFDDIFANPDKYNVIRYNRQSYEPKGDIYAQLQEKQLAALEEVVDTLLIDSLGGF